MDENKTVHKTLSKKGIVIILIIAFSIYGIFVLMNINTSTGEFGTSDHQPKEEIEERLQNKADASILAASMSTELKFETGESKTTFNIENFPENMYDIKVQLFLRDKNEEKIYESGIIEPGYIIEEDQLSKKLEKGEYACIARFIGYDKEGNQVKTLDAQINIVVEE